MTYRAPAAGVLRTLRFDAMTAIYDRRSGMTHLVAEVVPTILSALGEGDADFETLATRLFGNNTAPNHLPELVEGLPFDKLREAECFLGTTDRAALADRLEELISIGLVERR